MKRAEGTRDVAPIECLNPVKGVWRVRLAVTETEDSAEWTEHDFDHRPTADEVKALHAELVNAEVQNRILTGLTYKDKPVWLSTENQLTFRSAPTVPVRLKLGEGTDGNPVYHTFTTQKELTAFTKAVADHIATCLNDGWTRKDAFEVEPYLRE